jgi:hypothetical protein
MTAPTLLTAVAASAADALSSDRLFSNNFLNQHPVLMEYMSQAESQRDALFMDDEGGPVATSAAHRPPARPRASLAHRLRATTAVMTARGSMDVHELVRGERELASCPTPSPLPCLHASLCALLLWWWTVGPVRTLRK